MKDFLITIVTVTYNAENVCERTLESILSQDYPQKELIVIDGKSTDNTCKIIEKFNNQIAKFISEEDNGIYDAMNKGLASANGDFVIFMNAGDRFISNTTISDAVKLFTSSDFLYYGNALYFSGNSDSFFKRGGNFSKYRLAATNICHQTIFYPRIFFKNEKFNTEFKLFSDWDYNMRAYKRKIFLKYIDLEIAYYDSTGVSITQSDLLFKKKVKGIIYKNLGLSPLVYLAFRKIFKAIATV